MSRRADVVGTEGFSEALLAAIDDGVIIIGESGKVSRTNQTARTYFGLNDDVAGSPAAEVLPHGEALTDLAPDTDDIDRTIEDINRQPPLGDLPALLPHAAGAELVVRIGEIRRHFVVRNQELDVPASVADTLLLFEDVSAKRQIETQFESVLDYTTNSAGIVQSDGTIRYMSAVPDSPTDDIPRIAEADNILTVAHPDDVETMRSALQRTSETGTRSVQHCRLETATAGWKMFEVTVRENTSLPAVDGLILTARDVTDQHHFEQRRQVMNRILRHDLRNDMNVVVGHAEMLSDHDDRTVSSHAETIRKKALSLVNLGDKVRTIDKQLHGVDRDLRQINISQILREEIDTVHEEYPTVIIRSRIEELSILGNPLIRIAISNLLNNSIEHNDNNAPEIEVELSHRPDTERVELEIRDNGPGIPEGEKRAITNEGETPLEHISGLGLWLVKWIVDGMDGTLSITENSPRGTIVTLSFPAAEGALAAEESNAGRVLDPSVFGTRSTSNDKPIGTSTRTED
jgi:signal transduction histidine kinase